ARELGVEMARAEQSEESGLGIGIRYHRRRSDLLATLQHDAGDPRPVQHERCDRARHANLGARRARGYRERTGHRTHAAPRQPAGAGALQAREEGLARAWAEARTEHAVERERALELRAVETILEQVVQVHRADAEQLPQVR